MIFICIAQNLNQNSLADDLVRVIKEPMISAMIYNIDVEDRTYGVDIPPQSGLAIESGYSHLYDVYLRETKTNQMFRYEIDAEARQVIGISECLEVVNFKRREEPLSLADCDSHLRLLADCLSGVKAFFSPS